MIFASDFTDLRIYNAEQLRYITQPSLRNGRGLVTVANHASCIDDPLLWSIFPIATHCSSRIRWSVPSIISVIHFITSSSMNST